ncbi:MAG: shikimate kinase [Planctomycetota bacterium]|nr:shikimate kinase [Planctomycetota bacterium]
MRLIFIHGPIAVGKLTVARELAALTSFKLFHNHLAVDLALSLFEFGSSAFIELRESIWLEAFQQAARVDRSIIFTFSPEATVKLGFPARAQKLVEALGGVVHFIELFCDDAEIERRVENKSRTAYKKLNSAAEYRRLKAGGAFEYPKLPPALLTFDTGQFSAAECAKLICNGITDFDIPAT